MSTTIIRDQPVPWDQTIIRGDTWAPPPIKVAGDYSASGWLLTARVAGAEPFLELTDDDMTITYDADETHPDIVDPETGDPIVGLTTLLISVAFADTAALSLKREGRWSLRSHKAGVQKTWFIGNIEVIQTAATGAS